TLPRSTFICFTLPRFTLPRFTPPRSTPSRDGQGAVALAFLLPLMALAQVRESTFENRPALIVANDKLELTVLPRGGALAGLLLRDDAARINPLWDPLRYARETGRTTFGDSVGHFVCVDGFGPVSAEERNAGLAGHGEAHRQPWETKRAAKDGRIVTLEQIVKLPLHQETLTRTLRLVDGEQVVRADSELESHLAFDRPVVWAEHATIGAPFLEPGHTVVDLPAGRSQTRPYTARPGQTHRLPSGVDFTWPMAPLAAGGSVDLRAAPPNPNSLDHTTSLLDPSRALVYVTALHREKRLLLGYLFRREEFPWLQIWEHYPPDLRMARGLEFSTQPYDVPRREAIQLASMFGAPTYRWLPAKSKITSGYLVFYTRVPEGFSKVDDVRLESGRLIVEDRAAGRRITLEASLGL
ncbi:MAG: hypothetical protein ACRD96_18025, partial [Bryobacteraceae bacterium]